MKGHGLDPHPLANVTQEHFAVVYSPRKKRERFPANVVTIYDSQEEAITQQDHNDKLYAAQVIGPSKSSEGLKIFYLVRWL